ncbi:glycoside hydrolase family 17 protein [Coleophoma crateriformis]|uniref:Probable glucan endo-1,3-beta-glucosidase eglC n=1 Tax=Coleophoma crateriformis TaxID=565419 RepID=A0A3D8RCF2_9HELO|nr:glycoside hydrolase family 17 protein [Coleophoma crateriformis]
MKTSTLALALAATISGADAYWKGFNIAATNSADGSCKTQADWERDFTTMAALPGGFTSARLYASSDCNTLANAVPAALATGTQLLVGVWTEDAAHYDAEKQALLSAVQTYGFSWVVAVSVGSEDLYRGDTDANTLAQQIYDVRGMLSTVRGYSTAIEVGHVDTWTAWVDGANTAVIKACDFIGTDGYPYFQNTEANGIDVGYQLFFDSIDQVRTTVQNAGSGAWVWVTETGWPVSGPTENQAVPSVANAKTYWDAVACETFNQGHSFIYALQDYTASPSFGVLDANFNAIYDLTC